jgi:ABC-type transport system substrate-binding protein
MQEAPASLDPARVDTVYESLLVNQLFDGLVATDAGLNIVPSLASTWIRSDDGRTFTFTLRRGVAFHDDSPLTADDVVFTFERLLAAPSGKESIAASYLIVIEGAADFSAGRSPRLSGVQALDEHTVRITLAWDYMSFLEVLGMDGLRIVPKQAIERMGDEAFGRNPIGTGPFRLSSWNETGLTLAANPEHFAGPPHLDEVRILFPVPEDADAEAVLFQRGELEIFDVTPAHLSRLSEDGSVRLIQYQELSTSFLGMQTDHPALSDLRVRQAIAHAIDREALAGISTETRRQAEGILPPGLPMYSPSSKALAHDPATARRLLEEAGFPEGDGLPVIELFTSARNRAAIRTLDSLRAQLAGVGIRIEANVVPWSELNRRIDDHSAPLFMLGWVADLADPDAFLRSLFHSKGSSNYFSLSDQETDTMLGRGYREMNPAERARIYEQIERRILELTPVVPLYHARGIIATRTDLHGFEPGPLGIGLVNLERVWLSPSEVSS